MHPTDLHHQGAHDLKASVFSFLIILFLRRMIIAALCKCIEYIFIIFIEHIFIFVYLNDQYINRFYPFSHSILQQMMFEM